MTGETGFAVRLAGRPTQFGIDEEKLPEAVAAIQRLKNLDLRGFHIYSGSQSLDGESVASHFERMLEAFSHAIELAQGRIDELVFGAGLGIPYHDGDQELSLAPLRFTARGLLDRVRQEHPGLNAYVETGRFLVGQAGLFVTRVIRVKESRGLRFVICDGGMNHNLGAAGLLGGVAHRHYSLTNLSRDSEPKTTCRIVGPLCTAIDTLAMRAELPPTEPGDLIGVGASGAYGPTASPLFFISHPPPREILVTESADRPIFLDATWLPISRDL